MTADYLEASVQVPRRHTDLLESLMLGQGAMAVTLTDNGNTPIWEPGVGETPLWEMVTLTGLFPSGSDAVAIAAALSLAPGVENPGQVRVAGVEERDWERVWMDRFEPMHFGESLWIVPSGKECPDTDAVQLHLDPGLAFGTGTHPTTRLCLEWIASADLEGKAVMDFGCGSGVLGIAAALMGAKQVISIDTDPQAVTATRENARLNQVEDRLSVQQGGDPGNHECDVVISNILADILAGLAEPLISTLAPGGALVLTGILSDQEGGVRSAYEEVGVRIICSTVKDGWVRIEGIRN